MTLDTSQSVIRRTSGNRESVRWTGIFSESSSILMLLIALSDLPHSDPEGVRLEAQNCGWDDGVGNGTSGNERRQPHRVHSFGEVVGGVRVCFSSRRYRWRSSAVA